MFRVLPPVGEPILLGPEGDPPEFPGFHPVWTQSGTAALALAMQLAMERRPDITAPEVLIPGYGCPDLVAAVHFAGAKPVLVDIGADDPAFDPEALEQAWTPSTVAVVAVNFLGIRERVNDLARAAASRDVWLIEDSAQWYPESNADQKGILSPADAMILSFGRGKPVSLLGGGCLLLNEGRHIPPRVPVLKQGSTDEALWAKLTTYNWLLRPAFYGWVDKLPWLDIGATRYRPLKTIDGMDVVRLRLLSINVWKHTHRGRWREQAISDIHAHCREFFVDLPMTHVARAGRLLRYPILCSGIEERDRILRHARRMGLGVSSMYGRALPDIEGISIQTTGTPPPTNARAFADRLLTFPVHGGVAQYDIDRISHLVLGSKRMRKEAQCH